MGKQREMGREGNEEAGKRGNREMGKRGNGETGKRGNGEKKSKIVKIDAHKRQRAQRETIRSNKIVSHAEIPVASNRVGGFID